MSIGNQQPVRSCGKRHAFCKVCRPDVQWAQPTHRKVLTADQTAYLAPGYEPGEGTMWVRHQESMNKIIEMYQEKTLVKNERAAHMKELREGGMTLEGIGRMYGITRERVRQIVSPDYYRRVVYEKVGKQRRK